MFILQYGLKRQAGMIAGYTVRGISQTLKNLQFSAYISDQKPFHAVFYGHRHSVKGF
jgi:hypothetical protein